MNREQENQVQRPRVYWVNQYAATLDVAGGTRHFEMARELARRGGDVTLVASDLNLGSRQYTRRHGDQKRKWVNEEIDGVHFAWLPAGSYQTNDWRRAFSMFVFSLNVFLYLLRYARRGDVVVGSSPHLPGAAAAALAASVRRARFVLEVRDLWPETLYGDAGHRSLLGIALRAVANLLYRISPQIIVLAEGSKENIRAHGGKRSEIHFIPNGIDLTAFGREAAGHGHLPNELERALDGNTFVYTGAHGPLNGLELIIDAAQILAVEGSSIRILLVGDGASKPKLQERVRVEQVPNVMFFDPIPKALIPHLLHRATGGLMVLKDVDLFRYGVSPNKLFDYLGAGLPVVTNVAGDVGLTVERANAGVVAQGADAQSFADAMREVAKKPDAYRGHGESYVAVHHDRKVLADRLWEVLLRA